MKTARFLSLLPAVIMMLSAVSCASGGNDTTDTTLADANTTEAETTAAPEPYYLDALSVKPFGGTTFTMVAEDTEQRPNFCQEEMTGNAINDVVYERQMALEQRYNINIEYNSQGGVVDMATLPYLDFSKRWWSQTMLKDFNYKGHTYLGVGGSSPSYYLSAAVTLFNVDEAKSYGLQPPRPHERGLHGHPPLQRRHAPLLFPQPERKGTEDPVPQPGSAVEDGKILHL